MFLELLNDLLVNSSVFYVYFGLLIMTIGISQLLMIHAKVHRPQINEQFHTIKHTRLNNALAEQPPASQKLFINWFVKSFKRIDKLDDDQEDESASYLQQFLQIRGGQQWKKTTYSQPFGNMDLF